ncbi:hypothetical protein RCH18_001198, partial [Flavobacterium sp. PL11]|nr:hypothetical protein [Flavobacterium sp. PL11]
FKETAVHVSTYGGVRGRQSQGLNLTLSPTLICFYLNVFLEINSILLAYYQ